MENAVKQRSVVLDVAKGLAIIMVVFGHALITCFGGWLAITDLWYWAAGYHFAMAWFFFISGYLAYTKMDFKLIQRRFLQLMIPFLAWSIILYFYSSYIINYYPLRSSLIKTTLYHLWVMDTSGLWFLPALFAFLVLLYLTRGKPWAMLLTIVAAYLLGQVPWSQIGLHLPETAWFSVVAWFMPVFAGGYLVSKYRDKVRSLSFIKWPCLVAFPVCYWIGGEMNYSSYLLSWPVYNASGWDIAAGFYRFGMALLGTGMAFAVADLLSRIAVTRRVLQYLGVITLGIYCVHNLFVNIPTGSGIGWAIATTLIVVLLSTAVIWVLHRFVVTDFLFLGGVKRLGSLKIFGRTKNRTRKEIPDEEVGPVASKNKPGTDLKMGLPTDS